MQVDQNNFGIGEGTIGGPNIRAVIIVGDRILLYRLEKDDYWVTPGGGPIFYETSKDAIKRQIKRKAGFDIEIDRLLWSIENFFVFRGDEASNDKRHGARIHGIGFYYLSSPIGSDGTWQQEEFRAIHRQDGVFRWFKLDEIGDINLKPACLIPRLSHLPSHPEHIVCHAD